MKSAVTAAGLSITHSLDRRELLIPSWWIDKERVTGSIYTSRCLILLTTIQAGFLPCFPKMKPWSLLASSCAGLWGTGGRSEELLLYLVCPRGWLWTVMQKDTLSTSLFPWVHL